MKYPFIRPQVFFHFYKDWNSWSIGFTLTTMTATLYLGPLFFSAQFRGWYL